MSGVYEHTGRYPVVLQASPVDPNSTDWVYFSYQDVLRVNELVSSHSALISGGTIVTDSSYLGTVTTLDGEIYDQVYAVQFTPEVGSDEVRVTHRISTSTTDSPSLSRLNIDHTAVIPVETL